MYKSEAVFAVKQLSANFSDCFKWSKNFKSSEGSVNFIRDQIFCEEKRKEKTSRIKMNPGLLHDNTIDYVWSLIVDTFIFIIKSIYFFAEMVFLTILPTRFRKLKVSFDYSSMYTKKNFYN